MGKVYGDAGLKKALSDCRRQYCLEALRAAGGNVTQAAKACGMNRPFFHRIIKAHGIEREIPSKCARRGNWEAA